MSAGQVSVRNSAAQDCRRIAELARMTGRAGFDCDGVVAEYDGHLIAAVPFAGGEPVTDPYLPTDGTLALLQRAARR